MSGSARPWNIYPTSDNTNSNSSQTRMEMYEAETGWKDLGTTSMNAISFGFVATAVLISMFLIMAILEHLLRPNNLSVSTSPTTNEGAHLESGSSAKIMNQHKAMERYAEVGLSSVVMPGQKYPTCIAQPAPLFPFSREGIHWPPHHHYHHHPM